MTEESPHLAHMTFWHDGTCIGSVDAMQVPRVGDRVCPGTEGVWLVRAVQWTSWPLPGSPAHRQGETGPVVDLICSPSRGVHNT